MAKNVASPQLPRNWSLPGVLPDAAAEQDVLLKVGADPRQMLDDADSERSKLLGVADARVHMGADKIEFFEKVIKPMHSQAEDIVRDYYKFFYFLKEQAGKYVENRHPPPSSSKRSITSSRFRISSGRRPLAL